MKNHWKVYYWYWYIKLSIFCWLAKYEHDMGNYMQLQEWFGIISSDGGPKHCSWCGHDRFKDKDYDYINEGQICEYSSYCKRCDKKNGHWAYGSWTV